MGYWLKSYTDILDDPKYFRLSTNAQLAMHECFLIAKKLEGVEMTGLLPGLEEIAFHSRKPIEFWTDTMKELIDIGIVIENQLGYLIKNYVKRQKPIPQDERMRQYRKKKNNGLMDENDDATERSENETNCNGEKSKSRVRVEKEKSREREEKDEKITTFPSLITYFHDLTDLPITSEWNEAQNKLVKEGITPSVLEQAWLEVKGNPKYKIKGLQSMINSCIGVKNSKNYNRLKEKDYQRYCINQEIGK